MKILILILSFVGSVASAADTRTQAYSPFGEEHCTENCPQLAHAAPGSLLQEAPDRYDGFLDGDRKPGVDPTGAGEGTN